MHLFNLRNSWYDLELNIFPTDVTNHSGYPITTYAMHNKFSDIFEYDLFVRCGAEIWTVFGENGKSEFHCSGTVFRFREKLKLLVSPCGMWH